LGVYRDKVVGVFVRFRAPLQWFYLEWVRLFIANEADVHRYTRFGFDAIIRFVVRSYFFAEEIKKRLKQSMDELEIDLHFVLLDEMTPEQTLMINEMERIEVVKKVIAQKSNWSHCNA
jgi:hypothetical protein